MPGFLGTLIVVLLVAGLAALCARSLWRDHKSGGGCAGCSGNCAHCSGCARSEPKSGE